jgi:hypothetical protein
MVKKLILIVLGAAAVIVAGVLYMCTPATRKLDEVVFYDGPQFKLKLVRYYENLPADSVGETFAVQCASSETASSPAGKTQDAGWRTLGSGGAENSKSAPELATRERENYMVIDEKTLVWTGTVFNITFDACGHFAVWDPTTLPRDDIDSVPKPSYCAPQGSTDCRYYDFMGDRHPRFDDIRITPTGTISFVAHSKSFKPEGVVRVESRDHGRTWQLKQEHTLVPKAGLLPCPD